MGHLRRSVLVLAALAAGCGGGDSGGSVGGTLPACAQESRSVEPPAGLPEQLPLPPGIVLTDAQRPGPGRFNVRGVVRGDLDGVAGFFRKELPAQGFSLGRGDAEAHEQESPFTGNGYRGSWRVVKHPDKDCPVVAVFVVLIEQT